jgi:HEAT repeat protein
MSKADPIEGALNAIGELRGSSSERLTQELPKYLKHRSNLVVAKAAKLAGELRVPQVVPDLVNAFDRLMKDPVKLDKRCAALTEIVAALYELDYLDPEVYRQGLQHVQMEGSFGPPVDTAVKLRGISAQGLLRTNYPQRLQEVLPLLVDPEPAARIGAIRGLAANGGDAGLLLVRLKVLAGDQDPSPHLLRTPRRKWTPDPDVLAECFSALLAAAPEQSLSFVVPYIDADNETTAEAAIWALGETRLPAALEVLKEKWERTLDRDVRKVLLSAIAASRLPESLDFLCAQLREANLQTATEVLEALAPYSASEAITQVVRAAVEERRQKSLMERFRLQFRGA